MYLSMNQERDMLRHTFLLSQLLPIIHFALLQMTEMSVLAPYSMHSVKTGMLSCSTSSTLSVLFFHELTTLTVPCKQYGQAGVQMRFIYKMKHTNFLMCFLAHLLSTCIKKNNTRHLPASKPTLDIYLYQNHHQIFTCIKTTIRHLPASQPTSDIYLHQNQH